MQIELLQLEEERKIKLQETKLRVDELVKKKKNDAIETAINSPKNVCYSLDVNGNIRWEGYPPADLEEEINRRISQSMEK
ncbi:hypothetical protein CEXT_98341 [Caerostris extrusa]|uniref:Uncharacterized protein n=1 Tax=Caerostris extrusa TaxID=172846 RepID=A0AAV4QFJ4_CAEEX|nr:hypothetical protein CEXT_98341 [Caerostris extrusa]